MADGGDDESSRNAQDLETLLGKLLRLDVSALPFAVPASNPTLPGVGRTAIWALGLRNPWRFSFDRESGDLFIADVGDGMIEEVDLEVAGGTGGTNYGWPIREGTRDADTNTAPARGKEACDDTELSELRNAGPRPILSACTGSIRDARSAGT